MDQNNSWKAIDCSIKANTLESTCNSYCKNRLEEYKKIDFTPQDMEHINFIGSQITGRSNVLYYNNGHDIQDSERNGFLHIAIRKADLAIVTWLLSNGCCTSRSNAQGKAPLDLCIDQLLPKADEKNKRIAYDMLDILMNGYAKVGFGIDDRKKFITKLITLELEHKKHDTNFVLKDSWIGSLTKCSFCKNTISQQCSEKCSVCVSLSDVYKTVVDTEKNTYSHILVKKRLADQLYVFIQKGYVLCAPNIENKNPLDIALDFFLCCVNNNSDAATTSAARCCFYMLFNYTKKQQGNSDFKQCCKKHII